VSLGKIDKSGAQKGTKEEEGKGKSKEKAGIRWGTKEKESGEGGRGEKSY